MSAAGDSGDAVMEWGFSVSPLHCTIKGGVRLEVCLSAPPPDDVTSLHLIFSTDTNDTVDLTQNRVNITHNTSGTAPNTIDVLELIRDETQTNVYHVTTPACPTPGPVQVSLQLTNGLGHHTIVHTTKFTYTQHNYQEIVECVLQHVNEGLPLKSDVITMLESPEELDRILTMTMQGTHWSLQSQGQEGTNRAPQTTLLHLASTHHLISLAKHLITIPRVDSLLCLPNEEGFTPVEIARNKGNEEMLKVLTCALLQSSVTGGLNHEQSTSSIKRNTQNELLRFRVINEEWRGQIRRHKISSTSMGSTNFDTEVTTARERLPTPPFPQNHSPSTTNLSTHRRKSIAVMEQRHMTGCLQINMKNPELAKSERYRKQSWSVVVGGSDSRSVDTGLNELDRVIAADTVQQCMTDMQGRLDASQELEDGTEDLRSTHLDPTHLNLLYCYSVSCPLLTDDDESGSNSLLASTHTSPGPDIGYDSSPTHCLQPPTLLTSISVPDSLSETGVQIHLQRANKHPISHHSPCSSTSTSPLPPNFLVRVPQVITTRYSTEDLQGGLSPNNKRGNKQDGEVDSLDKNSVEVLHSTVNHDERIKDVGEDEEEEEGDLCQSMSAPHLAGDDVDGVEDKQDTSSCINNQQDMENTLAWESGRIKDNITTSSPVHRKIKREVMFGNDHYVQETKTSSDGSCSDHLNNTGLITQSKHARKKSHHRSKSMSVVELGGGPVNKPDKPNEEEEVDGRVLHRNRGSSMLKPNRPPLIEGSQSSSTSASRSNSIKDNNRSRASSLLTDASSMHESGESTSEDDTMPELSGLSCASLEGADTHGEVSTATPLVNEAEQQHLKPPNDSPDGGLGGVVLRGRKGRPRISQELRHSADVLSLYKNELESNPVLGGPATRRLNSESIDNKRQEVTTFQDVSDTTIEHDKSRLAGDSVFEQEVALSDVDVRVQSDDSLSQDKLAFRLTPSPKEGKKKVNRSPRFSRKTNTVKETTPPTPKKHVLKKGLTKDDVTPLVGKMRSILNSSENNDSSQAQSEQPAYEAATSPGGGSTSLDRVPRSPVTSVKSNDTATPTSAGPTPSKYNASPLTFQTSTSQLVPSSPPLSPTSPTRHSTSTSPITLDPSTTTNRSGAIFKSHSDKALKGSSSQDSKKLKVKSISLDGSASSVKEIMSVKGMIAEPLPEENTEDDELMEQDPKTEIAGKKESSKTRIRDNFFRRSKSRKKAMTILGGGPDVERAITESYSKDSGGTGAVRAKSAKQRPKLDDVFFSSDTNKTLPAEQEAEKSEGTTKEKRSPRKPGREHRRDSDSSLIHSPTSTTPDPSLCAVNEQKGSDPNTLSPAPLENMSDSDREEVSQQLVRSMSESHPELEIKEDMNWQRTMDRKLLRKMNKHERDRQNIMHELIQTERHHFRALHVLKLVFKNQMEKYLSEESLEIMFPELDNLIEISKSFLDRLEERRGKEGANIIVDDISDILLEEYTGENKERIINTFGEFCTYHLIAAEMYKEQLKKKQFGRLVQHLYRVKECQRLYLPDYYTSVSQRLTKMVQFLARLVKKTDMLKLDHTERLRQCQQELETLVTAVNQHVDNRKNQIELEQIQDKLEIVLSRSAAKHPVLKTMKELNLTAQNRRLIKKGDAQLIHGHGKQLPVHIVLVTDLVVLLTERDQKYFVPAILDLKPPIIRLYDLHVRVNASVRSGVQLLLLEKGSAPEMFRLEFKTKKEAKEWEVTLTDAGDVCKEKGIKCEFFGSEPVIMEDEKVEERRSPLTMRVRRSESQRSTASPTPSLSTSHTPSLRRIKSARATLDSARKVLSMFVTNSSSTTTDLTNSPRHARATITTGGGSTSSAWFNQSPKNRHNTIHLLKSGEMISQPAMIDRETSIDIDGGGGGGSKKTQKSKIKRKGLDRSSTFKGRSEDKKEKERAGAGGGGGGNEAVDTVQQQQLLICAVRMKDTIGDLLKVCEEKDVEIERLKQQLEEAKDAMAATPTVIMARNKISPRNSPPMFRPHSCHIDITDLSNGSLSQPIPEDDHESLTQPADTGT